MRKKVRAARDVFAFSRGGLTLISPYFGVPLVRDDRINKARDEHVRRARAARQGRCAGNGDCQEPAGAAQTA